MLTNLKGDGNVVARVLREGQGIELLRYVDQSWGVRRNGVVLGSWSAQQRSDCFNFFISLMGVEQDTDVCMIIPRLNKALHFAKDAKLLN